MHPTWDGAMTEERINLSICEVQKLTLVSDINYHKDDSKEKKIYLE